MHIWCFLVICFTSVSVSQANYITSNSRIIGEMLNYKGFRKKWAWPNRSTISIFAWRDLVKPRKTSSILVSVPDEIRIEHLPNTNLDQFSFWNGFRSSVVLLIMSKSIIGICNYSSKNKRMAVVSYFSLETQIYCHKAIHATYSWENLPWISKNVYHIKKRFTKLSSLMRSASLYNSTPPIKKPQLKELKIYSVNVWSFIRVGLCRFKYSLLAYNITSI
jgi:hypothetical protein